MRRWVVLSDHARAEAQRRAIGESMALQVAIAPEQFIAVRAGREIRQSRVFDPASGKLYLVRTIVDLGVDADTVVTVYRTSKVRKYWRTQ